MSTTANNSDATTPGFGRPNNVKTTVVPPIEGTKPLKQPRGLETTVETPTASVVSSSSPLVGGKSPPPNPIAQGVLNLLFVCFLYWVSTKILIFYGISNDIYLVYFMFYVFLYVTTLLLPIDYERFD